MTYGPKKPSKQPSTPITLKKDKRSFYHCEPVVVFTYANSKEKRCITPPSEQLNNENYMLPKLLNTVIPKHKYKRTEII